MQPCILRECELMYKFVLDKENTQLLEQYATGTSWMVKRVRHMYVHLNRKIAKVVALLERWIKLYVIITSSPLLWQTQLPSLCMQLTIIYLFNHRRYQCPVILSVFWWNFLDSDRSKSSSFILMVTQDFLKFKSSLCIFHCFRSTPFASSNFNIC